MMKAIPSPRVIAAQILKRKERGSSNGLEASLRSGYPHLVSLAQQMGVDVRSSLGLWAETLGSDEVADWLDKSVVGSQLVQMWSEVVAVQASKQPLIAALVYEERLAESSGLLNGYTRTSGVSLREAISRSREFVAGAALDAAFDASWSNRTVFSQSLQIARTYLVSLLEAYKLEGGESPRSLRVRYGISTVLAARFGGIPRSELESACEELNEAHGQGADNALSYYLEGKLWIYDQYGDRSALESAVKRLQSGTNGANATVGWHLNCVEVWMKLAGVAESRKARAEFLVRAAAAVDAAKSLHPPEAEAALRIVMLETMITEIKQRGGAQDEDVTTQGLRFPFCVRVGHVQVPASFIDFAPALIEAISQHKRIGEYIFRDVLSELYSYMARTDLKNSEAHLESAIYNREPPKRMALRGHRVLLANAEDKLLLAQLGGAHHLRRSAIEYLVRPEVPTSSYAAKLLVLAQDVARNGALGGAVLSVDSELALAVRNGDSRSVYEVAARMALRSQELERRGLGGRGGAMVLQDAENAIGQSFVFKRLSVAASELDVQKTSDVAKRIRAARLERAFGVVEHVAIIPATVADGYESGDVFSVRHFSRGQTLEEAIHDSPSAALPYVHSAAEFLGLFHAAEAKEPARMRRLLKDREVGRWLRPLTETQEARMMLFNDWWSLVEAAPAYERRDAHALNWLIDTSGRILAVDLDARGSRPFGYELAQLVEDVPLLDPDDWAARRDIVTTYVEARSRSSDNHGLSESEAVIYYAAGVLARAMWLFSLPDASSAIRMRAGRLFKSVWQEFPNERVGAVARRLHEAWTEVTGVSSGVEDMTFTVPERRRISRAMAYHLRHDPYAPATKDGWVHVDELAELLTQNGHRVTAEVLSMIAGAAGEQRFERDKEDIRAAYGHSLKTSIRYESARPPAVLYHATPLDNLQSIFEASAGLRPGKRQWVHMSDSPRVAMSASTRQQKPVALLSVSTSSVPDIVHAAGVTWLAPRVNPRSLKLVTLREQAVLLEQDS